MKHVPRSPFRPVLTRAIAAGATALLLVACDGIGPGSTIQRLEIVPANGSTQTAPYTLHECIRDQLVVLGTFTNGTRADFSLRAAWSSENPAYVRVSNRDIPTVFVETIDDGGVKSAKFKEQTTTYRSGTVVPVLPTVDLPSSDPNSTITITASFAGLSASLDVAVDRPELWIAPTPTDDPAPGQTVYLGPGTTRVLRLLARLADGRIVQSSTFNEVDFINPVLWKFVGGTFDASSSGFTQDFNKYVDGTSVTDPNLAISTTSGTVSGYQPNSSATAQAVLSLCAEQVDADYTIADEADPAYRPTADVQVAEFTSDPLVVEHEDGFDDDGDGTANLVIGTNEQLKITGALSAGGVQDLSSAARAVVLPFNDSTCTAAPTSATTTCTINESLAVAAGTRNFVAPSNDAVSTGEVAAVSACFPDVTPLASLAVSSTGEPTPDAQVSVAVGDTVTFTAQAVYPPGMDAPAQLTYTLNPGDGSVAQRQTVNAVDGPATFAYPYPTAGRHLARLYVADSCGFVSVNNAGARVAVGQVVPPDNAEPVAGTVSFTPLAKLAPTLATIVASGFSDPDDDPFVYEFDLGDGSDPIRQSSSSLSYLYGAPPANPPTVKAIDEFGADSEAVAAPAEDIDDITNDVTSWFTRYFSSNALGFDVIDADLFGVTLCEAGALTDSCTTATIGQNAFTFPGPTFRFFEAVGDFAPADGSPNIRQNITRFLSLGAEDQGTPGEPSDYVRMVNGSDGFLEFGMPRYIADPTTDVVVNITAAITTALSAIVQADTDIVITPAKLNVCPSNAVTCPDPPP